MTYRAGIIGCGSIAAAHARGYQAVPEFELVAAADPVERARRSFQEQFTTPHMYAAATEMLDREKPDVVQVGTRPDYITRLARACLERQIPVMPEKPLATDLPGLESLYRTAIRTRTPLVPMHTMRAEPTLAAIATAVRGGAIGNPFLGFSQKSYKWGGSRPAWYRTRRTFPGLRRHKAAPAAAAPKVGPKQCVRCPTRRKFAAPSAIVRRALTS